MPSKENIHEELSRYQREIENYLGIAPSTLLFEYREQEGKIRLDLLTVNPRHNQSFLFHFTLGVDKLDALQKMIEYVKRVRVKENTYTIQWMSINDKEFQTSYFRAKNIYEALDKLYYGRDMNTITVYTVKLNPIS